MSLGNNRNYHCLAELFLCGFRRTLPNFIPLMQVFPTVPIFEGLGLQEKRKPRHLSENCHLISMGSNDVLTSLKKQKKAIQSLINLIYENNTTDLKASNSNSHWFLSLVPQRAVTVFDMVDFKLSYFII